MNCNDLNQNIDLKNWILSTYIQNDSYSQIIIIIVFFADLILIFQIIYFLVNQLYYVDTNVIGNCGHNAIQLRLSEMNAPPQAKKVPQLRRNKRQYLG